MADINLKITSAGLDTGPFTIKDNLNNTLMTGVTRAQLLAGVDILGVDNSVTSITVTSSGTCNVSKSVAVDFTGGGGGGTTCKNVRFSISGTGCKLYNLSINGSTGTATFFWTDCTTGQQESMQLNDTERSNVCVKTSAGAPNFTGNGFVSEGGTCSGTATYNISYTDCGGLQKTIVLSEDGVTQHTACIVEGSQAFPTGVTFTVLADC